MRCNIGQNVELTGKRFEHMGELAEQLDKKWPQGVFSARLIEKLIENGAIILNEALDEGQIQPASLDLRLGDRAYRIRASFLPGPQYSVSERISELKLHEIDLSEGAVLERGCVYLVPLLESLNLPEHISASANPKSSTGRLDIFTRIIGDRGRGFDILPNGYSGALYVEISPRTFPILVRRGSRLSQIRFRVGDNILSSDEHRELHQRQKLVFDNNVEVANGVALSIDLRGEENKGLIGFRSKRHSSVIDVDKREAEEVLDFWDPLFASSKQELVLDPDEFYILVSRESLCVPPDYAAEMVPFDPMVGEFRVHYAGFFDPGFGYFAAGGEGARAVLEVRSREVPFLLGHGQIIGRLIYEHMAERPKQLYGADLGSNYQAQRLKLSKHFKEFSL